MLIAQIGHPGTDALNYCARQAFFCLKYAYWEGKRIRKLRSLKKQRGHLEVRVPPYRLHISGERYVLH